MKAKMLLPLLMVGSLSACGASSVKVEEAKKVLESANKYQLTLADYDAVSFKMETIFDEDVMSVSGDVSLKNRYIHSEIFEKEVDGGTTKSETIESFMYVNNTDLVYVTKEGKEITDNSIKYATAKEAQDEWDDLIGNDIKSSVEEGSNNIFGEINTGDLIEQISYVLDNMEKNKEDKDTTYKTSLTSTGAGNLSGSIKIDAKDETGQKMEASLTFKINDNKLNLFEVSEKQGESSGKESIKINWKSYTRKTVSYKATVASEAK